MMEHEVKSLLSEAEIISRIREGEKELFELLIRKYNSRLYRIGMSIIKDDNQIEDMMQNAYIKAYENLVKFELRSSFGTWLVRILINECLALVKKNIKFISFDNSEYSMENSGLNSTHDNATPANITLNRELAGALEKCLLTLPEKYRLVFVMREMEQMTVNETVDALQISESNVKTRLNRAKAMLRDKLNTYYKSDLVFNFHLLRCNRIVSNVLRAIQ